jgi:hypothetical protein
MVYARLEREFAPRKDSDTYPNPGSRGRNQCIPIKIATSERLNQMAARRCLAEDSATRREAATPTCARITANTIQRTCSRAKNLNTSSANADPKLLKFMLMIGLSRKYRINPSSN